MKDVVKELTTSFPGSHLFLPQAFSSLEGEGEGTLERRRVSE